MYRSIGFASVALVLLAGCASSTETPRGADESTDTTASGIQLIETQPLDESTGATATAATECQPGDTQACRQNYTDAQGVHHCLAATQFCSNYGTGWLPCGMVPTEQDGGATTER